MFARDPSRRDASTLAAEPPQGAIVVASPRHGTPQDFAGAAIAIGAFEDDGEAARFAAAARAAGVPVNVIDKPAFCDFSFGSIVNRSPLVIGISTDGAAPVFAQAIRAKLEALIPRGFARWADAARRWRAAVQGVRPVVRAAGGASGSSSPRTRSPIPIASRRQPISTPCSPRRATRARAVEHGSVTLVGAGPGDPELLTLRAVRALQSADVILIDDLVAPGVLDFARREAKKMLVGKTGYGPSCKQDEINALMITLAKAGKRVVRLKGGDPMIFGRAGEEIAACRAAGIAVEVVPGITRGAGRGEPARRLADAPRSWRAACNTSPATARTASCPRDIDWQSLADPDDHDRRLHAGPHARRAWPTRAIAHGLDPATPAVAVVKRDATRTRRSLPRRIARPSGAARRACRPARCW